MIRFCNKRPNHVCLGHECEVVGCVRERSVDQAPYKVEPPERDIVGNMACQARDRCPTPDTCLHHLECVLGEAGMPLKQRDGSDWPGVMRPHETPADVINAELRARVDALPIASPLRVLKGDEKPLTHADTAPTRTAQVIRWRGVTRHDLPVDRVLEGAADCKVVVVLGYKPDGSEFFAASIADGADVLWLLERLKLQLLTTGADTDPV